LFILALIFQATNPTTTCSIMARHCQDKYYRSQLNQDTK
jgi:hypothetical protein